MHLPGTVNAGHKLQLDVTRLTRTGDQCQATRQLVFVDFPIGKQVEQVRHQLVLLEDSNMYCGQQAQRAGIVAT